VVGLEGMTRRMQHYDVAAWRPWLLVAAAGAAVILVGIVCQIAQLWISIARRVQLRDVTGDPWNGRTLEWSTASPPPAFNFAVLPQVHGPDAYWATKQQAKEQAQSPRSAPEYEPLETPRNSPTGFVCAFFATAMGFSLIWHIWWLAIGGLIGAWATFVVFAWRDRTENVVPVQEVARIDQQNLRARSAALTAGAP
jgi:cytochrome o ubiquinol oxidase subunit 1